MLIDSKFHFINDNAGGYRWIKWDIYSTYHLRATQVEPIAMGGAALKQQLYEDLVWDLPF
jgi:hypothetical protein